MGCTVNSYWYCKIDPEYSLSYFKYICDINNIEICSNKKNDILVICSRREIRIIKDLCCYISRIYTKKS